MLDLAVAGYGMVCSVGLNAPAACAAIRCVLSNCVETRFMNSGGEWTTAAEVPLETPWRGLAKLANMGAMAIMEALGGMSQRDINETPLLLCLAEPERPGRIRGQEEFLVKHIQDITGMRFHPQSAVISRGRVGGSKAIEAAHTLLATGKCQRCVVAGVDSYLTAETLSAYEKAQRLLTESNSDGFIPGEAGAAVLLTSSKFATNAPITINGVGFGQENAHIQSEEPLRADGMVQSIKNALAMSGQDLGDLDFRICDVSGEQYYFKEAALALARILRKRKEEFDIWHPAECIGETGAAIVPILLAVASAAVAKGYSKGNGIICHVSNDDGQRGAIVVNALNRN